MVRSKSTSLSVDEVVQREGILSELVSLAKEIEISQGRGNLILLVVNEPYIRGLAEDFIRNRFESKKVIISEGEQISRLRREKGIDVVLVQLPESVGPPLLNALNYRREVFYETDFPNVIICSEGVLNTIVREAPDFWRYKASYHVLQGVRLAVEDILDLQLSRNYNTKEEIMRQMKISDYLLKKATNDSQKAFLFSEKANLHYMLGEYKEAEKYYTQSLELFESLGDKQGIAYSLHQLGMLQQDQGNYKEAEKYYTQSLELKKSLEDKQGIARSLGQLGNLQYLQGSYKEAEKYYTQSLELFESLGDKRGIAHSLHQLGMLQQDQGNYKEAEKYYTQSLELKKSLGDKQGIARSLHQLGMILESKESYEEAEKYYINSLGILLELNSPDVKTVIISLKRVRNTIGGEFDTYWKTITNQEVPDFLESTYDEGKGE